LKSFKKILFFSLFISLSIAQFSDIKITYEYNESSISENKLYILEEFISKIEKYYRVTNFSHEFGILDIPIKLHFIFENINFRGENNYNSIVCHFLISNSYDLYYYTKSTQLPYYKGKEFYLNELNFDPLISILDYFAFLFIAYELDRQELFLGDTYYNRCLTIASNGSSSNYSSGWENRYEKIRKIKNNDYLRIARNIFNNCMQEFYKEEPNLVLTKEYAIDFLTNLKLIHNKIGYDKNTLKFINAFHKQMVELFDILKMQEGIVFLYNFDDENQLYYKEYLE